MSPLYTYNDVLLQSNGSLAIGPNCCCTDGPQTEVASFSIRKTRGTLDLPSIDGGCTAASPYGPDDLCYQQIIAQDPYCCLTAWDNACETQYQECQNQ